MLHSERQDTNSRVRGWGTLIRLLGVASYTLEYHLVGLTAGAAREEVKFETMAASFIYLQRR